MATFDQFILDMNAPNASIESLAERYRALVVALPPRECLIMMGRVTEEAPARANDVILRATQAPVDPAFVAKVQALREWKRENSEEPLDETRLKTIVNNIEIFDRKFLITRVSTDPSAGWFLQVTYDEIDVDTGRVAEQRSRKWLIEPDATETDVVRTVFAAVSRSYAHVIAEHFTYKGKRVFGPHVSIDALIDVAGRTA